MNALIHLLWLVVWVSFKFSSAEEDYLHPLLFRTIIGVNWRGAQTLSRSSCEPATRSACSKKIYVRKVGASLLAIELQNTQLNLPEQVSKKRFLGLKTNKQKKKLMKKATACHKTYFNGRGNTDRILHLLPIMFTHSVFYRIDDKDNYDVLTHSVYG